MPLSTGTASYVRYAVVGELPAEVEEPFAAALEEHAFREIELGGEQEESAGWVCFDNPFLTRWERAGLLRPGGLLLLCLRVDTLKIPAVTLKAHTEQAGRERCAATRRERLPRPEREALRLEVKRRLRLRSLARMQLVEAAWSLGTGEVRLFSTSRSVNGRFSELFQRTFGLELRALEPLALAWLRGFGEAEVEALSRLDPESFHLEALTPQG